MIVGPMGTPYEDCLFVFDLQLPDNYPLQPPVVHYHSYVSERLNPNLYPEGRVCYTMDYYCIQLQFPYIFHDLVCEVKYVKLLRVVCMCVVHLFIHYSNSYLQ